MLRNGKESTLTVAQIAAHLGVKPWNVTRELQLFEKGQRHRLPGAKVLGEGVGRGGQWRIEPETYLNWLQIPAEDRTFLGPDGLPELIRFLDAAAKLGLDPTIMRTMIRQMRWPHIAFGRNQYLTHNQLERLRVLLNEDHRERHPADPGAA
jgi:hypothetical protein